MYQTVARYPISLCSIIIYLVIVNCGLKFKHSRLLRKDETAAVLKMEGFGTYNTKFTFFIDLL